MNPLPRIRPLEILHVRDDDGHPAAVLRDPEGCSDDELILSEGALFVAAHFDGEHTVADVQRGFEKRYGKIADAAQIEALGARLDEAGFLETGAFETRRREMTAAFLAAPTRPAAHAGLSYPDDPAEAEKAVTGFFEAARGMEEAGERPPGRLAGLVAPHIDLRVGGPLGALAWRLVAEAAAVDTVVVLGTAHACPHPAWIVLDKPFETPLGTVPVDEEACRTLAEAAGASDEDRYYHRKEHAIEFQALFLAALVRAGRPIRMVPVLCGSIRDRGEADPPDAFVRALGALLASRGERAIVAAAADLAHVGMRFGDADPIEDRHLKLLETKDRATLATVAAGDAVAFFRSVMEAGDPRRICGLSPIHGLLAALPGARGKVLGYEQAVDETGTVTFAGVGLWRE